MQPLRLLTANTEPIALRRDREHRYHSFAPRPRASLTSWRIPLSSMISSLPCDGRRRASVSVRSGEEVVSLGREMEGKPGTHPRNRDTLDVAPDALDALADAAARVCDAAEDLDGLSRDELEADRRVRLEERGRAAESSVRLVLGEMVDGIDDGLFLRKKNSVNERERRSE